MSKFTHETAAQGSMRMKVIAAAAEVEIKAIVDGLVAGLGRPPTVYEQAEAELIGATVSRMRRLRACGRCDARERRELARVLRTSSFRTIPAPEQTREIA